ERLGARHRLDPRVDRPGRADRRRRRPPRGRARTARDHDELAPRRDRAPHGRAQRRPRLAARPRRGRQRAARGRRERVVRADGPAHRRPRRRRRVLQLGRGARRPVPRAGLPPGRGSRRPWLLGLARRDAHGQPRQVLRGRALRGLGGGDQEAQRRRGVLAVPTARNQGGRHGRRRPPRRPDDRALGPVHILL
ncbi:MAG: hypothetical protein AVDCRST_MAG85-4240, partial [uncultured Solirubrobacteraceae bacterium]